jgi:hypothetical protein
MRACQIELNYCKKHKEGRRTRANTPILPNPRTRTRCGVSQLLPVSHFIICKPQRSFITHVPFMQHFYALNASQTKRLSLSQRQCFYTNSLIRLINDQNGDHELSESTEYATMDTRDANTPMINGWPWSPPTSFLYLD